MFFDAVKGEKPFGATRTPRLYGVGERTFLPSGFSPFDPLFRQPPLLPPPTQTFSSWKGRFLFFKRYPAASTAPFNSSSREFCRTTRLTKTEGDARKPIPQNESPERHESRCLLKPICDGQAWCTLCTNSDLPRFAYRATVGILLGAFFLKLFF